tara:strand:- start:59 stop:721 length:663 start_codon:yes stop_codon:yes gene_type:complete
MKIVKLIPSNKNQILFFLILLTLGLVCYLIYEKSITNTITIEGFKNEKLRKFKKHRDKSRNKTKEDFNANNLKYYGYKTNKANNKEDFVDTTTAKKRRDGSLIRKLKGKNNNRDREDFSDTKNEKLEQSKKLLERFRDKNSEPGSKDNFQNVMDEIDKIDANAFTFNSMGSTISRYSDNLENRIKYAKKQNSQSRLDSSMAQLGVLWDEGKKLFLFRNVI